MCRQISFTFIIIALLISGLGGCKKRTEAADWFEQAKVLYENQNFIAAKNLIDSIDAIYPREIGVRKEAMILMRLVERSECLRDIAYCDSILPVLRQGVEPLKKGFVFVKDSVYDKIGVFIWNSMTVERNLERSYVRCGVNEEGEMYVASVFFGSRPLEHTGLKLSTKNGLFAVTDSIPYDGGLNYRFVNMGNTTEVVTYKGEHCKAVANFIYLIDEKEQIKAEYTGGRSAYSLNLSESDKKAIKATLELALVLNEIYVKQKTKDRAESRITVLDNRLNRNKD
jgi:hypothetical protein